MTYYKHAVLLTSLTMQVDQALPNRHVTSHDADRQCIRTRDAWSVSFPKSTSTSRLAGQHFKAIYFRAIVQCQQYFTPCFEILEDDSEDRTSSQVVQGTFLELQYHDAIIQLHRPFILFRRNFSPPERNSVIDGHATTSIGLH